AGEGEVSEFVNTYDSAGEEQVSSDRSTQFSRDNRGRENCQQPPARLHQLDRLQDEGRFRGDVISSKLLAPLVRQHLTRNLFPRQEWRVHYNAVKQLSFRLPKEKIATPKQHRRTHLIAILLTNAGNSSRVKVHSDHTLKRVAVCV